MAHSPLYRSAATNAHPAGHQDQTNPSFDRVAIRLEHVLHVDGVKGVLESLLDIRRCALIRQGHAAHYI